MRLLHDPAFWGAFLHTLYFVLLTAIPLVLLGLGLATLVLQAGKLALFAQAAFFLPYILPVSVVTLIAGWVLERELRNRQSPSGSVDCMVRRRNPWIAGRGDSDNLVDCRV